MLAFLETMMLRRPSPKVLLRDGDKVLGTHTLPSPVDRRARVGWLLGSGSSDSGVDLLVPAVGVGDADLAGVGARNSAHIMRPADIRGSGRRVDRVVGRDGSQLSCGGEGVV